MTFYRAVPWTEVVENKTEQRMRKILFSEILSVRDSDFAQA